MMKALLSRSLPILADISLLIGITLFLWLIRLIRNPWELGFVSVVLALGFAVRRTRPSVVRKVWEWGRRWMGRMLAAVLCVAIVAFLVSSFFWLNGPVKTSRGEIPRWQFLSKMPASLQKRTCQNQITLMVPAVGQIAVPLFAENNRLSLSVSDEEWSRMSDDPQSLTEKKFSEGALPFTIWTINIVIKTTIYKSIQADTFACDLPDGYYDFFHFSELDELSPGAPEDSLFVILEYLRALEVRAVTGGR
jgi:hypothetical protein